MTIRPGAEWGVPGPVPSTVRIVDDDSGLRNWVVDYRTRGVPMAPVGVRRGDLVRACGTSGVEHAGDDAVLVTVDVLRVLLDRGRSTERTTWAVSTVVARRSWWRGEVVIVTSAGFFGRYDVAPRSHPNDGRAELLAVSPGMSVRQRWAARRRARLGTHLPHPGLATQSGASLTLAFRRPLVVWADGERLGLASGLAIDVEPDALEVYL